MQKTDKLPLTRLLIACFLSAAALFCILPQCAAQDMPKRSLLALSKTDHTMAIVDPVTLKVTARVPVGPDPHEVIASADGTRAFVSNMGNGEEQYHELDVIDLVNQEAMPPVDTRCFTGLHGLDFQGGKVWFTAQGAKSVGYYDATTGQIDWCMGTGQDRTHMIYVTADTKKIYTTNVASGTVSILEYALIPPPANAPAGPGGHGYPGGPGGKPHMDWQQTIIPVSRGSEGFDVSPDGSELWTAAADDGSIAIIDLAGKKVKATIDAKAIGANRLKFTPDGKRVLISSLRSGDLFVYDAVTHKEIKKINIGHGAAGILVDADGSRAFVGCTPDNYVAVINLNTLTVSSHIDVGGGPDGLAWAPAAQ